MKVLYYDCFSGISGDMNLGALIDLGVDKNYLIEELAKLNLKEYELKIYQDSKMGITGTRADVILLNDGEHHHSHDDDNHSHHQNHAHDHNHEHDHEHEHSHHHHYDSYGESQEKYSEAGVLNASKDNTTHVHRNLKDIEEMINASSLSKKVKSLSVKIFLKVAEAEAKVHGKPLYEVHFHEVGAVDSIVDIVGAAICLDYLKADKIICSTIEIGSGFVKCAHGILPVPAPATAEILKGSPIKSERVPFEATTPTGAAILSAIVDEFNDKKNFTPLKIAYGIGKKDGVIPNVLRVMLVEEKDRTAIEEALMLECNMDDMNSEIYEYVMDKLFEIGAQDVFLTPIIMKKSRPAVKLSVLCSESKEEKITNIIFQETTTLGIRKYRVSKSMLERKYEKIHTNFGEITVKSAYLNGAELKHKMEYEDCKRAAAERGVPLKKVYEEAERQWNNK